jgi:hypothetical protein
MPSTRQTTAVMAIAVSAPPVKNQMATPANRAPSASRSSVESRKLPQRPPRSCIRAMMPSMTSEKMKAVMKMVPHQSCPSG